MSNNKGKKEEVSNKENFHQHEQSGVESTSEQILANDELEHSEDEQANVQEDQEQINSEKETEVIDALAKANEQIEDLKDKYLRTIAEFDNYKKRTLKEKTELILNGGEKTITTILPILDDMERAIANANKADSIASIEEGWELIFKKLIGILENLGVKKIDTENKDFDVDYHEAVAMVPGVDAQKKGKVIDCLQTGYMMNDKVIRHAKVAVGQ